MFVLVILHFCCSLQKDWGRKDGKLTQKQKQKEPASPSWNHRRRLLGQTRTRAPPCLPSAEVYLGSEETITESRWTTMQRQPWEIMSWGSRKWPGATTVAATALAPDARRGTRCLESLPWAGGCVWISPASQASCPGLLCPFSVGGRTG